MAHVTHSDADTIHALTVLEAPQVHDEELPASMQLATFFFDFDPFLCLAYSDEMHTELRKIRPHASFFAQLDAFVGQLPADEEVDEDEDQDQEQVQVQEEQKYREAEEQVHYLFFSPLP